MEITKVTGNLQGSSDNCLGCLRKSWHSQDKNLMAVSCKKLALTLLQGQKDFKFSWVTFVCVWRAGVGQGLRSKEFDMSVSLRYLQQPKASPKQIRKPHMMMSQRAHLNDEELVCLTCLLFTLI